MRINRKMNEAIKSNSFENALLPCELQTIVEKGFVERDECYFLSALMIAQTNAKMSDFSDRTGFECFINSIHIDDYAENYLLEIAIKFVGEMFSLWRLRFSNIMLNSIISMDDFGVSVKFHVMRQGETWVAEDLEKYEEAMLIVDSRSTNLFL